MLVMHNASVLVFMEQLAPVESEETPCKVILPRSTFNWKKMWVIGV